jgi:hypothetical protein
MVVRPNNGTPNSTESRVVRYRWHPWFGCTVWIHCTRVVGDETFVRCGLTPDLTIRASEMPSWMLDAGVCGVMDMAEAPQVCVGALRALKALLGCVQSTSGAARVLQAEHRDLSSAGGAHAIDSEAASTGPR